MSKKGMIGNVGDRRRGRLAAVCAASLLVPGAGEALAQYRAPAAAPPVPHVAPPPAMPRLAPPAVPLAAAPVFAPRPYSADVPRAVVVPPEVVENRPGGCPEWPNCTPGEAPPDAGGDTGTCPDGETCPKE